MPCTFKILPNGRMLRHMLRNVAVIALPPVAVFELGVLCELFGYDRTAEGLPAYDFAVCSLDGGPVPSRAGFEISVRHDLSRADEADLVVVAPFDSIEFEPPAPVLDALRRAHERGAWVMSVCTGAFALGAAGLLDGRRCTTHWLHAARLAQRYPAAIVDPDVLYVAGRPPADQRGHGRQRSTAGLHLVRHEHGSADRDHAGPAGWSSPPHRDGGQAQFIETPGARRSSARRCSRCSPHVLATLDRPAHRRHDGRPGAHGPRGPSPASSAPRPG